VASPPEPTLELPRRPLVLLTFSFASPRRVTELSAADSNYSASFVFASSSAFFVPEVICAT